MDWTFDSLDGVPDVFTTSAFDYRQALQDIRHAIRAILSPSNETLALRSARLHIVRQKLHHVKRISLHCSEKPVIATRSMRMRYMKIRADTYVSLTCVYRSRVPVTVYWTKNEVVIPGKNDKQLDMVITPSDSGIYKCKVVSSLGESSGNSTLVTVYTKPHFLSRMQNVTFIAGHYPTNNATFVCNVTSNPTPDVSWYFRRFSSTKARRLYGQHSPLLTVRNPTVRNSGYYYCVGSNRYGVRRSVEVRLDVLRSHLATQKVSLSVEVKGRADGRLNFTGLIDRMTQRTNLLVAARLESHGNRSKLFVDIFSDPGFFRANKASKMEAVASSRQTLARTISVFTTEAAKNAIHVNKNTTLRVNGKSLTHEFRLNMCRPGYRIREDGFSCIQCPVGTHGSHCTPCKRGTYQPYPAQPRCLPCPQDSITKYPGSSSRHECKSLKEFCRRRKPGYYRHPTSCSKYIGCNGHTYVMQCRPGSFFDEGNARCVWLFDVSLHAYNSYLKRWWNSCDW